MLCFVSPAGRLAAAALLIAQGFLAKRDPAHKWRSYFLEREMFRLVASRRPPPIGNRKVPNGMPICGGEVSINSDISQLADQILRNSHELSVILSGRRKRL